MKYYEGKKVIYVTDLGSNGRIWTAIYGETGQPIPGFGTYIRERDAEQELYRVAKERGWESKVKRGGNNL